MEKFLWNFGGFILFLANIWSMMFCFATGSKISATAMIAVAAIDFVYTKKRPTWLEV